MNSKAKLSIFGLGYVGAVSAACFCERGNRVIGVDVSPLKVETLAAGKSPILEARLEELLGKAVASGLLTATTDGQQAILESDMTMVCVGTPSQADGAVDASAVERVCEQIGRAIAAKQGYHIVVIRSTTMPWMAEKLFLPILEKESGKRAGEGFGFAVHPEFLREGSAVKDFFNPPKTVVGSDDEKTAAAVAGLYDGIVAPVILTTPDVAMMVKYTDNAFHAIKVAFANEIGRVCKKWNIDAQQVMDVVCQDTKLNISRMYLRPAFAFGGSCLPKDVRAIVREGERSGASVPLLSEILRSNNTHMLEVVELVRKAGVKCVGLFGLTFKSGTDDLRESAAVAVARRLAQDGCDVLVYDANISMEKLIGANKQFINSQIPSLSEMMATGAEELFGRSELIVVVDEHFDWAWGKSMLGAEQMIVDVQGGGKDEMKGDARYVGLCW